MIRGCSQFDHNRIFFDIVNLRPSLKKVRRFSSIFRGLNTLNAYTGPYGLPAIWSPSSGSMKYAILISTNYAAFAKEGLGEIPKIILATY